MGISNISESCVPQCTSLKIIFFEIIEANMVSPLTLPFMVFALGMFEKACLKREGFYHAGHLFCQHPNPPVGDIITHMSLNPISLSELEKYVQ